MTNFGTRSLAAIAVNRGSRQTLTTQNTTECSQPLFATTMLYLNKDISVYDKKYIIVLPIIIYINITNVIEECK